MQHPPPVPIALGPSDRRPSLLFGLMAPRRVGARDQVGAQPRGLLQVGAVIQTQDKHCKGPEMKRCLDFSHTCKQTLCPYLTYSKKLSASLSALGVVNKFKCFPILFASASCLKLFVPCTVETKGPLKEDRIV